MLLDKPKMSFAMPGANVKRWLRPLNKGKQTLAYDYRISKTVG